MNDYEYIVTAVMNGDSRAKIASELGISPQRVSQMVSYLRKKGVDIHFKSSAPDISGALAVYASRTAVTKAPVAPKLTKAQEEARAITLKSLREIYNEPEGTYEELNARLQASAPPTAHESPEPDGWGDDEAKRVIAELEAPSVPARTSAEVDAKLDALFKEE